MISITAIGYIFSQPEVHYVGEKPVIKFKVVDKQRRKNKAGEFETHYESITFECWGDDALYYAEKLTKGREVEVIGINPKTEKWTGDDGKEFSNMVFKLLNANFPYREQREPREQQSRQGNAPQAQPRQQRYATQSRNQGNAQQQHDAEPSPRGSNAPNQAENRYARRDAEAPPAYADPRNSNAGKQEGVATQNRFNRGQGSGAPRTEY